MVDLAWPRKCRSPEGAGQTAGPGHPRFSRKEVYSPAARSSSSDVGTLFPSTSLSRREPEWFSEAATPGSLPSLPPFLLSGARTVPGCEFTLYPDHLEALRESSNTQQRQPGIAKLDLLGVLFFLSLKDPLIGQNQFQTAACHGQARQTLTSLLLTPPGGREGRTAAARLHALLLGREPRCWGYCPLWGLVTERCCPGAEEEEKRTRAAPPPCDEGMPSRLPPFRDSAGGSTDTPSGDQASPKSNVRSHQVLWERQGFQPSGSCDHGVWRHLLKCWVRSASILGWGALWQEPRSSPEGCGWCRLLVGDLAFQLILEERPLACPPPVPADSPLLVSVCLWLLSLAPAVACGR